jgi:hypothetical protein
MILFSEFQQKKKLQVFFFSIIIAANPHSLSLSHHTHTHTHIPKIKKTFLSTTT